MEAFQYNDLSDIDDCEMLSKDDALCLEEIKAVLMKFNKTSKFGVNLLHRHFDILDSECVVEYTDKENRILTTVVEKKRANTSRRDNVEVRYKRSKSMRSPMFSVLRESRSGSWGRPFARGSF